ncbi:MAG TPA: NUDIX hydrolase [Ktedonobacterales bacterium]|nr:NUDIX hydrolase [Ktedonobacterales bacterium]
MKPGKVRPLALCVFRDGDRILVQEGYDPSKNQTFYRALGGAIEFGERSQDTVAREIREEIDAKVTDLEFLATIESVFDFDGLHGHEICLVYDGRLADPALYRRERIVGAGGDGKPIIAVWVPLDAFRHGTYPLYPDGLLELLDQ